MTDANIITPEENQMTSKDFQRLTVGNRYSTSNMIDDIGKIVINIKTVLDMATPEEISNGSDWYFLANRQCQSIADRFNKPLATVVGVMAALSPGCQWEKNIIDCIAVLEHGDRAVVSTYGANKAKAVSIAADGNVSVLGGSKVKSFFANILNPHLDDSVTCDRHAANAAADWYQEYSPQKFLSGGKYKLLEGAYFTVGRQEKLLGHQVQAIVWVTYKRLFSSKTDAQIDMPEWLAS